MAAVVAQVANFEDTNIEYLNELMDDDDDDDDDGLF